MIRILPLAFIALSVASFAQQVGTSGAPALATEDAVFGVATPSATTIHANVERTVAGKKDSGTLTLKIAADGSSSEDWQMSSGHTSFEAGSLTEGRECSRTNAAGVKTKEQSLACLQPVPWFAPWAGATLSKSGLLTARAAASKSASIDRIFSAPSPAVTKKASSHSLRDFEDGTSVTVSYDPTTHLPTRSMYKVPAGPYGGSIEIEVEYSDYRDEGGFMLPHHLVRHVQHTRDLDVQVSNVTIN